MKDSTVEMRGGEGNGARERGWVALVATYCMKMRKKRAMRIRFTIGVNGDTILFE